MNKVNFILLLFFCLINQQNLDAQNKSHTNEVMREKDILFNNNVKRFFSIDEFNKFFGKPDRTELLIDVQPCNYIFENEDGSKDVEDAFFYKDGSRFEKSGNKIAVDEFRFTKNNFIQYKGHRLNSSTTIAQLQKIFPNAVKNISKINVKDEGILQVIELREDENNISDGIVKIFIKNGSLHSIHWWFPC